MPGPCGTCRVGDLIIDRLRLCWVCTHPVWYKVVVISGEFCYRCIGDKSTMPRVLLNGVPLNLARLLDPP